MTSILIGIESSAASDRALALGLRMAAGAQASALIVHAIPWSPCSFQINEENAFHAGEREHEIHSATTQLLEPAPGTCSATARRPRTSSR